MSNQQGIRWYVICAFCLALLFIFSACKSFAPSSTTTNPPKDTSQASLNSSQSSKNMLKTSPHPSQSPKNTPPTSTNTAKLLVESPNLANNLQESAKRLQTTHQALYNHTSPTGRNTDATFMDIQSMKDALRNRPGKGEGDLSKFKAWAKAGTWEQLRPGYHHHDWWMFPIDRTSVGQGGKYTVYWQGIADLKADQDWLRGYRLGAILLMQARGWNVKCFQRYSKCYTRTTMESPRRTPRKNGRFLNFV